MVNLLINFIARRKLNNYDFLSKKKKIKKLSRNNDSALKTYLLLLVILYCSFNTENILN